MKRILLLAFLAAFATTSPRAIYVTQGVVHDIHRMHVGATNVGVFADPFGAPDLGCEWPAGSGHDYLYGGALWVGAVVDGVAHVSTAFYETELLPDAVDPIDTIYESTLGMAGGASRLDDDQDGQVDEERRNGRDDDGDGQIDEDFAAVSDEMLSCEYRDDRPASQGMYPDHVPLHLAVYEESHGWSAQRDFHIHSYRIANVGTESLEELVVGIFLDPDIGTGAGVYYADDCVGFGEFNRFGRSLSLAYAYDCAAQVPGYIGVLMLGYGTERPLAPNPTWDATSRFSGAHQFPNGDPVYDAQRYAAMTANLGSVTGPADMRLLASVGPFASLGPGETARFDVALVIGNGFDGMLAAAARAAKVHEHEIDLVPTVTAAVLLAPPTRPAGGSLVAASPRPPVAAGKGSGESTRHAGLSPDRAVAKDPGLDLACDGPLIDTARIRFTLERESDVDLEVYDATGRCLRRILLGTPRAQGAQSVTWDGRDDAGRPLSSGVYLVLLNAGRTAATTRVIVVR